MLLRWSAEVRVRPSPPITIDIYRKFWTESLSSQNSPQIGSPLTALAALAVYVIWQAVNTGIQVAGTGPDGIDLLDLVQHGIAPSLAAAGVFLLVVVVLFRCVREVGLAQGRQRGSMRVIWPWLIYLVLFVASALNAGLPAASVTLFILTCH